METGEGIPGENAGPEAVEQPESRVGNEAGEKQEVGLEAGLNHAIQVAEVLREEYRKGWEGAKDDEKTSYGFGAQVQAIDQLIARLRDEIGRVAQG